MIYESKSHITNKHPKHSQVHAYSLSGEYLGHVRKLELSTGWNFDKWIGMGASVVYDRDTCTYTVRVKMPFDDTIATIIYEVVVTQNLVILGYRRIEK